MSKQQLEESSESQLEIIYEPMEYKFTMPDYMHDYRFLLRGWPVIGSIVWDERLIKEGVLSPKDQLLTTIETALKKTGVLFVDSNQEQKFWVQSVVIELFDNMHERNELKDFIDWNIKKYHIALRLLPNNEALVPFHENIKVHISSPLSHSSTKTFKLLDIFQLLDKFYKNPLKFSLISKDDTNAENHDLCALPLEIIQTIFSYLDLGHIINSITYRGPIKKHTLSDHNIIETSGASDVHDEVQ